MAGKQQVASSKGVAPVSGFERQVEKFKRAYMYGKDLKVTVDADKDEFRQVAAATARSMTGAVSTVEFLGADGGVVAISMPDPTKDGNRKNVPAGLIGKLADAGVEITDYTETVTVFKLSGPFVAFIRKIIAENYTSKGQAVPEDIKESSSMKLSDAGVKKLVKMLKSEDDKEVQLAEQILDACINDPTVNVR